MPMVQLATLQSTECINQHCTCIKLHILEVVFPQPVCPTPGYMSGLCHFHLGLMNGSFECFCADTVHKEDPHAIVCLPKRRGVAIATLPLYILPDRNGEHKGFTKRSRFQDNRQHRHCSVQKNSQASLTARFIMSLKTKPNDKFDQSDTLI